MQKSAGLMKKSHWVLLYLISLYSVFSQVLINAGAEWKYLDDGSDQGAAWRTLNYDDSHWSSGHAQLGYGDGDEATIISYGSSPDNKHICYYFRKIINVTNPSAASGLKISLLRDDGAVVYINGVEVVRSNMPDGPIHYNTRAASTVAGTDEDIFFEYNVPSSYLQAGLNVIAVEVHQRRPTSSDVSFDLKLEFAPLEYFKKLPYLLYTGKNDEMLIIWQLNSTQNCVLEYGTDTTYSLGRIITTEYGNDHQHKVTLTGLTPGQQYYYRVIVNGTSEKKGSFRAGLPTNATDVTFFAYGDSRSYPDIHNAVAESIRLEIEQNPSVQTFIIHTGDLVTDGDMESMWQSELFNPQFTNIIYLLAHLPYMAAIGNHEGTGVLFARYFPYPMFRNNRYYYSFDYGPVHVTIIDQETSYAQGSTQYNWIVNDLATTNKPWKIAVFHKPGWSAGAHSNNITVQNSLQPLFERYGVQLTLTGHNHYYARAVVNGVHHVTTGGGGSPLYTPDPSYPHIVKVDRSYHYCKIEIKGDTLRLTAIRRNGTVIESFTIVNSPPTFVRDDSTLSTQWNIASSDARLVIATKSEIPGNISVYDSMGRKILEKHIFKSCSIELEHSGIYFIRYTVGNKRDIKKVVFLK